MKGLTLNAETVYFEQKSTEKVYLYAINMSRIQIKCLWIVNSLAK